LLHHNKYRVNLHHIISLFPPKFRRFGGVPIEKIPKHGCIIGWVVGEFSANSVKILLLNEMQHACNLSNIFHILTTDRKEVKVLRKIYFMKKSVFLKKLLM